MIERNHGHSPYPIHVRFPPKVRKCYSCLRVILHQNFNILWVHYLDFIFSEYTKVRAIFCRHLLLCLCLLFTKGSASYTKDLNLRNFTTGVQGFKMLGAVANDRSASSVSGVGDVNGDGIPDVIVGSYYASPLGRQYAGISYVIFGHTSASSSFADIDLLTFTSGPKGFKILGALANGYSGFAVSGAGDVNGDGVGDVLVGAKFASPNGRGSAGITYVIFGHNHTTAFGDINLGNFTSGARGFLVLGAAAGDNSGISLSAAGDVNADGIGDIIIGANGTSPLGRGAGTGAAYVIFGHTSASAAFTDIDLLTFTSGVKGYKILGAVAGDSTAHTVCTAWRWYY